MSENINVILNGKILTGKKGETILEFARRHGVEIPTLCHDPRIEPYSSCYLCVVEIEGMRGLQPSCSTKITEGMKIETHNSKIFKARKMALELLLSNHYADCIGPCKQTCPAGVDVQGYLSLIEKGMYSEAIAVIKETNPLPAICGRVCVRPCEVACRRNLLNEGAAVGIDYLKRFAADKDLESPNKWKPTIKPKNGKKVAIVGGGPAGLSVAFFLQKEGYQCDIYEASPKAGGWLRYGIPEYRLPNDVLQKEIDNITEMGVNIFYNKKLGENLTYKALKFKYDAIVLAIGSQVGAKIGCEGEDAIGVLSGIDFLKQMELTGVKMDFTGKKVAVLGGGNTAMDCCRTSIRCGADKVYVIYRRTEKEMPANPIEIHESKVEGVEYMFLTAPVKINKDENGRVKSITCQKMILGEPDASGRRRPIPQEGSEFEVEVDYVIAAIGQKTYVNFLDDVNRNTDIGELRVNKWGDIEVNPVTLQTGVERIFACGDGVTGPATLIQAIAQARIAARSVDQFLKGEPIAPPKPEFLSKKENFEEQKPEDYIGKYKTQPRLEMPVLDEKDRKNFKEVELGYPSEELAIKEASRCLECGCTEYYTCDLKKYATEYEVDQKRLAGEYKKYNVDFRHPFIEIDNNKCILCARCIRICKEVVGANALGLVNRGFETYVAPAMGDALQDTTCESCGLCIETCPTGAITENVPFKPGPVKTEAIETICNYCSVGCTIEYHHRNGFVFRTTGKKGKVNKDGSICKFGKFGYRFINDKNRITKPLMKIGNRFEEISFEEAFNVITYKIKSTQPDENAFYAGARLTNEEMYLIQKLARLGAKTNNVTSFHYLDRGPAYATNYIANSPIKNIVNASKVYVIGSELNIDNPIPGFILNKTRYTKGIPVEVITELEHSSMESHADFVTKVKSYYYFVKAVNHYLLSKGLQNAMFINDNCTGFEEYKSNLLKENYSELVSKSGLTEKEIVRFAEEYNNHMNAIIIFSEKYISSNCSYELFNLAMITGKLGKFANGLIPLKEKNNSQGLFDMGICAKLGVSGKSITDEKLRSKLCEIWKCRSIPTNVITDQIGLLRENKLKNLFIFGEDPIGCAKNKQEVAKWIRSADFVVVQDYFITETAESAHIILPASLPEEIGGSFTNTRRIIQKIEKGLESKVEIPSYKQLLTILSKFHPTDINCDTIDVMMEFISLLDGTENVKYQFHITDIDNPKRIFDYGCDYLYKYFDIKWNEAFSN